MSRLYVSELGGMIKVGKSLAPNTRLETHRTQARVFGAEAGRSWVSEDEIGTIWNERLLIDWCAANASERGGHEYFHGLDFDAVVEFASALPARSAQLARELSYTIKSKAVRTLLERRRLSQRKLAGVLGCAPHTVYRVMGGRPIGYALAKDFAKALDRPVEDLFAPAASSVEQQLDKEVAAA